MDFAIKQMKSMGWSEGKGLGPSQNGITTAIKPSSQKDTRGLGFTIEDSIQLKNQWWAGEKNGITYNSQMLIHNLFRMLQRCEKWTQI